MGTLSVQINSASAETKFSLRKEAAFFSETSKQTYATRFYVYVMTTLTEVFPCFFLSCKANARLKPAKTGHGPHSSELLCYSMYFLCCSMYFCVVLCIVCFVTFPVLFVCIYVLNNCHRVATQLQLNISYHIMSYHIISYIISYISYHISYHITLEHRVLILSKPRRGIMQNYTFLNWIIFLRSSKSKMREA
jgi:hypothetical protein